MIQRCDLQWKMLGLGVVLLRHISARIKQPVYSAEYYIRPAIPPIWLWIGCYVSALQLLEVGGWWHFGNSISIKVNQIMHVKQVNI